MVRQPAGQQPGEGQAADAEAEQVVPALPAPVGRDLPPRIAVPQAQALEAENQAGAHREQGQGRQPQHQLAPQGGVVAAQGCEVEPVGHGAEPAPAALEAGGTGHHLAAAGRDVDHAAGGVIDGDAQQRPVGPVGAVDRPLVAQGGLDRAQLRAWHESLGAGQGQFWRHDDRLAGVGPRAAGGVRAAEMVNGAPRSHRQPCAAELARAGRGGLGRAHGEGVGLQRGLPAHALVGVELGKGHVEHHQAGNEPGQDQHPAGGAEPAVGEVEDAQQAGVHRRAG